MSDDTSVLKGVLDVVWCADSGTCYRLSRSFSIESWSLSLQRFSLERKLVGQEWTRQFAFGKVEKADELGFVILVNATMFEHMPWLHDERQWRAVEFGMTENGRINAIGPAPLNLGDLLNKTGTPDWGKDSFWRRSS